MDGVTIRGGGEQARLPLAVLPLLLCGVWGFLLVFRSLDGVSFHPVPAFLTAAVLLSVLWAGCRRGGRWFVPLFLASLTLLCVLATRYWAMRPGVQAGALLGYWYGDRIPALAELFGTALPEQVTELSVILSAVLSITLFSLECLFRDHEIPYTLATALLVYVPLLGLRADIGAVFLLALFRLALRGVQNALSGGVRSLLPGRRRTRLAGQCAAILCILLALSFLSADLLVQRHEDALYAPAYHAEELAVRGLREAGERWRGFFANSGGGGLDGEIGGGNQYQTNGAQLELSASTCPTQTLYLRSFAGGDYTGGAWAAADDDAIFRAVQPEMMPEDPEAWAGSARLWFNGMYYEMNYELYTRIISRYLSSDYTPDTPDDIPPFQADRTLRLRNLSRGDNSAYTPYYSSPMPAYRANPGGSPYFLFPENAYGFLYYQQDEMRVDWNALAEVNHGMASWYGAFQDAYLRQAREVYTRVPEELVPRLAELVRRNPLSDLDEITTFILHTLHSMASYSLTPGRSPANRDVVEDFLFEKGKGYCQHFAAAAVLMYRLYGVPARYAAGYAALPSSFAPVYGDGAGDGTAGAAGNGLDRGDPAGGPAAEGGPATESVPAAWYARITDRAAHAWAEIFLDGYGWTPVEVTPASADSAAGIQAAASYPGFDQEEQAEIAREHGWSNQRNDSAEKGEDDGSAAQNGDSVDNTNPADSGNPGVPEEQEPDAPESEAETSPPPATLRHDGCLAGYLAFFLFTLLLLAPPVFISRRTRILAKIDAMDCREALYRLGNLLRFAGTPVEEEDFSRDLPEAVPVIEVAEAARLSSAAARAAFGPPSPGTEEDAFARGLYCRAAGWLYGTLNWRRRIFFRWFAVYR